MTQATLYRRHFGRPLAMALDQLALDFDGPTPAAYPKPNPRPQPGVYWLTDPTGSPLYIGSSRDVRKRLTYHHQRMTTDPSWQFSDTRLFPCETPGEALQLEAFQIRGHRPPWNTYHTGKARGAA